MVRKYINITITMVLYLETNLKFAYGHERLQLVRHYKVVEGGLSEIRWEVLVPDVDRCVS